MPKWKGIINLGLTPDQFHNYIHALKWAAWRPKLIVLHNTQIPSLAQRPDGWTREHMLGLEKFYRDERKWSAGPHLFTDDKKIWLFTPLTQPGVHSPSWNSVSLGIEMLGDYDKESFVGGRGLRVRTNTLRAIAMLMLRLELGTDSLRLHREDTRTTHKSCPGANVNKDLVLSLLHTELHMLTR